MIDLFIALSPLLTVGFGGLLLMLAEALGKPANNTGMSPDGAVVVDAGAGRSEELGLLATVILFSGAASSMGVWLADPATLGVELVSPWLQVDRYSLFFSFILCISGGLCTLLGGGYLEEHKIDRGEFFTLVVFSTVGAIALGFAGDLLTVFVALETMSLGVYCMIGLRRSSPRAGEAALKYFLLGSFAAAIMMFGAALLYAATGHTDLAGIGAFVGGLGGEASGETAMVIVGMLLMLIGMAFKISAVPIHMWAPDAYEGAPTPTTSFMAAAVKTAAFAVLLRILLIAFGDPRLMSWGAGWPPVMACLSVLSMTIANVIAGRQSSVKRMLAYSSISHAGYLLMGVCAAMRLPEEASASVMFYLAGYCISTIGAFGALILCGSRGKEAVSYADLAGIGRRHPAAAAAFALFVISLAGMPPTAGFFGKLYVFRATIDAELYSLAIIGLLNSIVGAYYYMKVLVFMYMREPIPGAPIAIPMRSSMVVSALIIAAALVVAIGVLPGALLEMAAVAAAALS